jgi:glucose/arabinose dehydrogenase
VSHRQPLLFAALAVGLLIGCAASSATQSKPAMSDRSPTVSGVARAQAEAGLPSIDLQRVLGGLNEPVGLANAGDGSGRLFVVEKRGRVVIVRDGAVQPTPLLDITPVVGSRGSEQGLLGLAFHPRFATNGQLFVYYTDQQGDVVVARYQVAPGAPDLVDAGSATTLLTVDEPYANHNGGSLAFGPDGFLYIGLGDGGSAGDPRGNGQNRGALLAKILRIDVDNGSPYAIPADNPFVGDAAARPEVWAYGLRNPWRFSFDRATGDLYIGDVGQNAWEWVNFQPAGARGGQNYGWNVVEGSHCYPPGTRCDPSQFVRPVAEYDHSLGCSVTGGYVYRGPSFPSLQGVYFFGDYCSGRIWGLAHAEAGQWRQQELLKSSVRISSFGEDEAGEVYLLGLSDGTLYRLVAK